MALIVKRTSKEMNEKLVYTTDSKVKHYSRDEELNVKLGRIIGEKFVQYRKLWDAVNRFELQTEFPLFLQLYMNQNCNLRCPHCINGKINRILKIQAIPEDGKVWGRARLTIWS